MKKRRILSLVVAAILLVSTLTVVGLLNVNAEGTTITSEQQFVEIFSGQDVTGSYTLGVNLNMKGIEYTPAKSFSGTLNGQNNTIVNLSTPLFATASGTVENLTISGAITTDATGAVGALANAAGGALTVTNVTNGVSVTTTAATAVGGFIGEVTGTNSVTFTGCTNSGAVTSTGARGTAGFVGETVGTDTSNHASVSFTDCANTAAIVMNEGQSSRSGAAGFMGYSTYYTATLTRCVNSGNVTGFAIALGGLFGDSHWRSGETAGDTFTAEYCANLGVITNTNGGGEAGGIAGRLSRCTDSKYTINYCYNMGALTGDRVGGIVAYTNDGTKNMTINGCYNGQETATANYYYLIGQRCSKNQTTTVDNFAIGTSVSKLGSQYAVTFTECTDKADLISKVTALDAYIVNPDQNNGYPILAWQCEHSVFSSTCVGDVCDICGVQINENGSGEHAWGAPETVTPAEVLTDGLSTITCGKCGHSEEEVIPALGTVAPVEGVYNVYTDAQLQWVMYSLNNGTVPMNAYIAIKNNITLTDDLTFVNNTSSTAFSGTIDGENHTISNLTTTLFYYFKGTIKDISFDGKIETNNKRSSTICYRTESGAKVLNVHSSVEIVVTNADINVAGLVGYTKGNFTMTDCSYSGTISLTWNGTNAGVGGLVGYTNINGGTQTIENCDFVGDITVTADSTGDLWLGGILGTAVNADGSYHIIGCANNGTLTVVEKQQATYIVGGIVGQYLPKSASTIEDCVVTGKMTVPATARFEGIVSDKSNVVTITNSTVSGDNFLTAGEDMFTGYLQTRDNGEYHDVRIVLVANLEKLMAEVNNATVTITFKKDEAVAKTIELDLATEFEFYQKATAAGEVFFAEDGYALFGAIVTDIPDGAWDTLSVNIVSDAEASLYSAATSYEG